MCDWGKTKVLNINGKDRDIDICIYDLVKLLNENYKTTIACCCGHRKQPASIVFEDKSEMRIMTFEQARKVDKLFPPINLRYKEWKFTWRIKLAEFLLKTNKK